MTVRKLTKYGILAVGTSFVAGLCSTNDVAGMGPWFFFVSVMTLMGGMAMLIAAFISSMN